MSPKPWPWNKTKPPVPADWGIGMTVCIAAICEPTIGDQHIVIVSDRMVSMSEYFSGDNVVRKVDPVLYGWTSMLAGNDVSPAMPILSRIARAREGKPYKETLVNVVSAFKSAYKEQRLEQIEDEIIGPLGFTWDTFRLNAKTELTENTFERIIEQIRRYELDVSFLVSGFDPSGIAHIFTVCNPGKCDYYDKINFWAIGSGQHQALASMFASNYLRHNKLEDSIAKVICAKFAAESASGVGRSTWAMVSSSMDPNTSLHISPHTMDALRNEWNKLPKFTSGAGAAILENLSSEKQRRKEMDSSGAPVAVIPNANKTSPG